MAWNQVTLIPAPLLKEAGMSQGHTGGWTHRQLPGLGGGRRRWPQADSPGLGPRPPWPRTLGSGVGLGCPDPTPLFSQCFCPHSSCFLGLWFWDGAAG